MVLDFLETIKQPQDIRYALEQGVVPADLDLPRGDDGEQCKIIHHAAALGSVPDAAAHQHQHEAGSGGPLPNQRRCVRGGGGGRGEGMKEERGESNLWSCHAWFIRMHACLIPSESIH
jgi:hypothetical protein